MFSIDGEDIADRGVLNGALYLGSVRPTCTASFLSLWWDGEPLFDLCDSDSYSKYSCNYFFKKTNIKCV